MVESLQAAAENHLPVFITASGETDVLFILNGCLRASRLDRSRCHLP